ncbi:prenyltransferase [Salinivirga cyanobacteriivorans]|uniref:Prenyltransferase n=1 Tax=Salinivirga cyanobacteriivorans TaxID=1307839 RepID=A0A0S2HW81_9BACT|nr:geranylgeranylglycerol-phosphate geranylgeranyltransferase [Salinivirga cyanobacteriivorans]ALO14301.1 prenyltransferase [Salinivirga cyanobacteriivorans]
MQAFLRLIRWPNLIIIPLVMAAIRFAVIEPMLHISGMSPAMPLREFWLMVLATMFLGSGGYIINDYFDRKIDLINKPGKVVVGQKMSRIGVITWHIIFNSLAVLIGLWLAWQVHLWWVAAVYAFVSGIFWFYSTTYKRMFLIGNIIVSLLTAMVPFQVLLFEYTYQANEGIMLFGEGPLQQNLYIIALWVTAFSFFAFMTNLIREIVKDFEDIRGDMRYGRKSVPIVLGLKSTKWVVQVLTLATILAIIYVASRVVFDWFSWVYISTLIILPLLLHMYLLHFAHKKRQFHRISQLMKIVMFTGLLYALIVRYNVLQIV